jgi:hypothetical protein
MGLFKKRKKDVLDLTKTYEKEKEKLIKSTQQNLPSPAPASQASQSQGAFGFFGNFSQPSTSASSASSQTSQEYADISGDDKRKKLAKRLMDMTEKIEDLSNQIYHLQQRIEVLEKKSNVGAG